MENFIFCAVNGATNTMRFNDLDKILQKIPFDKILMGY